MKIDRLELVAAFESKDLFSCNDAIVVTNQESGEVSIWCQSLMIQEKDPNCPRALGYAACSPLITRVGRNGCSAY